MWVEKQRQLLYIVQDNSPNDTRDSNSMKNLLFRPPGSAVAVVALLGGSDTRLS